MMRTGYFGYREQTRRSVERLIRFSSTERPAKSQFALETVRGLMDKGLESRMLEQLCAQPRWLQRTSAPES